MLGIPGILGGKSVYQVDKRGEVSTLVEAGLLVLLYLLPGSPLQYFVGGDVGVGSGICVADADIKDRAPGSLPE